MEPMPKHVIDEMMADMPILEQWLLMSIHQQELDEAVATVKSLVDKKE